MILFCLFYCTILVKFPGCVEKKHTLCKKHVSNSGISTSSKSKTPTQLYTESRFGRNIQFGFNVVMAFLVRALSAINMVYGTRRKTLWIGSEVVVLRGGVLGRRAQHLHLCLIRFRHV